MSDIIEDLKTNTQSVLDALKGEEALSQKAAALHLALYIVTNKMGKEPDEVSMFLMMNTDLVGDTSAKMIEAGVTV
jgi:hypothetical protein